MTSRVILSATLVALAVTATAAEATTRREAAEIRLSRYAPEVDVTKLTDTELAVLMNILRSTDTDIEKRFRLRSFVDRYQSGD
ncbi:hypothetical protein [Roseivivax jejudonensis]|uniref:hypothetical protein n=1 Tax=Roseivivax jejudonensis TaxID=1529041 RepID=UPI001179E7F4|nr:hypothetical protein [Roseivivax jejudonensis]